MLGTIAGAALLTATPLSLQWSQRNVALSLDTADARIGRPLTATSVAGVSRRVHRRAYRRAVYGTAVAGLGGYGYYRYSSPTYSGYSAPSYYGYSTATAIRLTTVVTPGRTTAPMRTRVPGRRVG